MALLLQFCLLYSLKTTKKRHLVYMSFDSYSIMRYCITCICQTQHNLWLIIRVAVLKWRPWSGSLPLFCQRENFISDINVCSPICKGFSNQWIFLKTPNIIHIWLVIWKALKKAWCCFNRTQIFLFKFVCICLFTGTSWGFIHCKKTKLC